MHTTLPASLILGACCSTRSNERLSYVLLVASLIVQIGDRLLDMHLDLTEMYAAYNAYNAIDGVIEVRVEARCLAFYQRFPSLSPTCAQPTAGSK